MKLRDEMSCLCPQKYNQAQTPLLRGQFLGFLCHCVWVGPSASWPHGGKPSSLAQLRTSEHPGCSQTQGKWRGAQHRLSCSFPWIFLKGDIRVAVPTPGAIPWRLLEVNKVQPGSWGASSQHPSLSLHSHCLALTPPHAALFSWGAPCSRELPLIAPMCSSLCTFLPSCDSLSWLLVPGCLHLCPRGSAALSHRGKHESWWPRTSP